ncbi:MAG TPA: hypothetical protein VK502_02480 [Candidatus Saccharimonadales bacterium]|nr:hypothetical protein [Candidatus Saccharimonadales bacterium]
MNIALAIAILAVVWAVDSPIAAFALVLLSKWRILAVRPRYWFANIQANSVDIIVSLSIIILLYAASGAVIAQYILTAAYIVWLLFIKPRSKRVFVTLQAGTATFLGVSALMTVSYDWMASPVVLLMWLIGYSAARHVLSNYDEAHISFYSLLWGFIVAEIGWLTYHWTFAYELSGVGNIKLVQSALIVTSLSFLAERIYASYTKHGEVRSGDVILPALLSISLIVILLVFFNRLGAGTI